MTKLEWNYEASRVRLAIAIKMIKFSWNYLPAWYEFYDEPMVNSFVMVYLMMKKMK